MTGFTNPYPHLGPAAHGDLSAQRALAKIGEDAAIQLGDIDTLMDGLVFARMAKIRGDDTDVYALIRLLALAEELCAGFPYLVERRASLQGELIAVTSALADSGHHAAEQLLNTLVEYSSPLAAAIAQSVRKQMAEV